MMMMGRRNSFLVGAGLCLLLQACAEAPNSELNLPALEKPNSPQLGSVRVNDHGRSGFRGDMRTYAKALGNHLNFSAKDEFVVDKNEPDQAGDPPRHFRLHQYYDGVRVFGGVVAVHQSERMDGVDFTDGNVVQGMATNQGFSTRPTISGAEAARIAKEDFLGVDSAKRDTRDDELELVVYPLQEGGVALAWHLRFFVEPTEKDGPASRTYFVDAQDGKVLDNFDSLMTLSQASGPGGNAKLQVNWVNALDVEPDGAQFKMDTARIQTINAGNQKTFLGPTVTGPLNPFGDAAANDAHGFAEIVLDMMQARFGYNSIDNAGFKIVNHVHYRENPSASYENAFWDGARMVYGDGGTFFHPLSGGLDVVGHEIHHGFTSKHSNLTYKNESGGMNESFSDIAGTVAEYEFQTSRADFLVGEDIARPALGGFLRDMCTPENDGFSIAHHGDYVAGLDVHFSSGIMNKAFCLAAKRFSAAGNPAGTPTLAGVARAAKAFYEANDNYWVASSTFVQGAQGTIDAARALAFSNTEVGWLFASWEDVGVPTRNGSFALSTSPLRSFITTFDTSATTLSVARDAGFTGAATVAVANTPTAGVTLTANNIAANATSTSVTVRTDANLAIGTSSPLKFTGQTGTSTATAAWKLVHVPRLGNGSTLSGLAGAYGNFRYAKMTVPAATQSLTVTLAGGTGDPDLYLRRGAIPGSSFDCRSIQAATTEECTISTPQAGDWYILVVGEADYSGVSLAVTWLTTSAAPVSLSFTKAAVEGTKGAEAKIRLDKAAPSGGATVLLSSNKPAAAVPISVVVPAGAQEHTFSIPTTTVTASTAVTVQAYYAGIVVNGSVSIEPAGAAAGGGGGDGSNQNGNSDSTKSPDSVSMGGSCSSVHWERVSPSGILSWLLSYSALFLLVLQIIAVRASSWTGGKLARVRRRR